MAASKSSSKSGWVLLNREAFPGCHTTTATNTTSNGHAIQVSFSTAHPPLPSSLFVDCPSGVDTSAFVDDCRVVCTADNLLLLRVPVKLPGRFVTLEDCDYFIYHADEHRPSLHRLPHPHPLDFHDDVVGLLPRGGQHYMVAALLTTPKRNEFELILLDSKKDGGWVSKTVTLDEPRIKFPIEIPRSANRLNHHDTSSVLTLGGDCGTIAWVDLWSGLLLCDLLLDKPKLRTVPLPMPMKLIKERLEIVGCPKPYRDIAFINGHLKFIALDVSATRMDDKDEETRRPSVIINNWEVTTWSNSKMTGSWDDWHRDCTLKAADIKIDDPVHLKLLHSELLNEQQGHLGLDNLVTSDPCVDMDNEDVVYLMARAKFLHRKAWVLTFDTKKARLQQVAEFGTESRFGAGLSYCPSRISQYMCTI